MWDLVMVGLGVSLFLLAFAYIDGCERLQDAPARVPAVISREGSVDE